MSPSELRLREKIVQALAYNTGVSKGAATTEELLKLVDVIVVLVDEEVRNAILVTAKVYGRDQSLPDSFNPIVSVK